MILRLVLYGCEIWSLILREEHKLGVCEEEYVDLRRSGGSMGKTAYC